MASKVLLIEDDASFRKAVSDILTLEGYQVLQAPSGKAGITLAQKEMPDLVILDLIMPGMKGLEVCQVLKQDAQTARLPIIILTGQIKAGGAQEDELESTLAAHRAQLYEKPTRMLSLFTALDLGFEPAPRAG